MGHSCENDSHARPQHSTEGSVSPIRLNDLWNLHLASSLIGYSKEYSLWQELGGRSHGEECWKVDSTGKVELLSVVAVNAAITFSGGSIQSQTMFPSVPVSRLKSSMSSP